MLSRSSDFTVGDYFFEEGIIIRIFDSSIPDHHFEWHRDKKDRTVNVLYSKGEWKFQFDDALPFVLKAGDEIKIRKESFHKLHKSKNGILVISILEY